MRHEEEETYRPISRIDIEPQDEPKPEPPSVSEPPPPGAHQDAHEHMAWKKACRADSPPSGLFAHLSYLGGKWNCGKTLAKMIEAHREPGQTYIEPFVGGANVL